MKQLLALALSAMLLGIPCKDAHSEIREIRTEDGVYIGETEIGIFHGHGTFHWRHGGNYEGNWTLGRMDGRGVYTNRHGKRTNVFHRYGKLAIDHENLPESYLSMVCRLLTNVFKESSTNTLIVSEEIRRSKNHQSFELRYLSEPGSTIIRRSSCKFTPNDKKPYLEMIEGRVHDIHWVGDEAVEMGDLMMEILFIPWIEE